MIAGIAAIAQRSVAFAAVAQERVNKPIQQHHLFSFEKKGSFVPLWHPTDNEMAYLPAYLSPTQSYPAAVHACFTDMRCHTPACCSPCHAQQHGQSLHAVSTAMQGSTSLHQVR